MTENKIKSEMRYMKQITYVILIHPDDEERVTSNVDVDVIRFYRWQVIL